MKSLLSFHHHRAWLKLQLPAALLIALLQRTPVVRVLTTIEQITIRSPLGDVLKSALAVTASFGAVHTLAGATTLQTSQAADQKPVPVSAKVGTAISPVVFNVENTINIMSWKIDGTIPAGLRFVAAEDSTKVLTGPGTLDATGGGVDDGYGGMIGGITSTHAVLTGTPTQAGSFTIRLQAFEFASLGGLATDTFNFTVNVAADTTNPNVAPSITTQPQAASATTGGTVTLTAAATGTPAPTFQWNKNGSPISGATSATLVLNNVSLADAGAYTVTVTNGVGTPVTSNAATVTVTPPATQGTAPLITQSPSAQAVVPGATVAFNAAASGSPAPTYQWRKDGVALAGQTKSTLILTNVTAANAGSYTVVASNGVGTPATSTAAALTVASNANFGHLTNLAIFATLTAAVPDFTVATVIGGGSSGTKPMLVRAVGPSLGQLGVGGFVADPIMQLFAGSTLTATNDNWNGDAQLGAAFTSVGAFPYASAAAKDAAIFLPTAAPGSYSVKVSGVSGGTGLVLAEIYDATPAASFSAATHRLLDVSVLKQIAAGEQLTVGFNVAGATSRTVLIRAVGPTLGAAPFNVPGTMADPQLQLFSGQTVLASNDDWGGDAQVNAAMASVGAFAFGSATSKDAVILATLGPGNYTAVVQAASGTAGGLTLVEVYDVP